jgi:putative flippase GtrA
MKPTSAIRAFIQPELISDSEGRVVTACRRLVERTRLPKTLTKFVIVGGIAFLIYQCALFLFYDTPVIWFLPGKGTDVGTGWLTIPDARLLVSSVLAIELAILFQFNSHERWTFRHRRRDGWIGGRFLKFHLSSIVSPTIIVVATNALTAVIGWPPYLSAAVGVLLGFGWNWSVGSRLIWPQHMTGRQSEGKPAAQGE